VSCSSQNFRSTLRKRGVLLRPASWGVVWRAAGSEPSVRRGGAGAPTSRPGRPDLRQTPFCEVTTVGTARRGRRSSCTCSAVQLQFAPCSCTVRRAACGPAPLRHATRCAAADPHTCCTFFGPPRKTRDLCSPTHYKEHGTKRYRGISVPFFSKLFK